MSSTTTSAAGCSPRNHRVLILDNCDPASVDILRAVADVDVLPSQKPEDLVRIIPQYDAIMVRSATKVTEEVISAGTRLKIIGRAGVGVDNITVSAASARGIFVVNSPQGNTVAAAEHTVGLMLAAARNIPAADASLRASKWERSKYVGYELQHRTLGLVGLGQVGGHVAKIAKALGMRLLCYDPYVAVARASLLGVEKVESVEKLLAAADVVSLHIPLLPQTEYLINAERLALMKPTAILINCSRGKLVDEPALCQALRNDRLAAAALDVFEAEGIMPASSPLLDPALRNKLVLTPHLGASTREAQVNVALDVASQIKATLQGEVPAAAVNLAGIKAADVSGLGPLVPLALTLGSVAGQLAQAPIAEISVEVGGAYAQGNCEPLLLAAASGVLGTKCEVGCVNFVNVRAVASLRQTSLILLQRPSAPNLISVSVQTSDSAGKRPLITLEGSVTPDGGFVLQSIDGIKMYMLLKEPTPPSHTSGAAPSKRFYLYTRHVDQPLVLADVCYQLGEQNINIANCHLGRKEPISAKAEFEKGSDQGTVGIAIFHIDDAEPTVPENLLKAVPAIRHCTYFEV